MVKRKGKKLTKKKTKRVKKLHPLHKNKVFFGLFLVMLLIFTLSIWQQKYGADLSGMATAPVSQDVADVSNGITTSDGSPCITEFHGVEYIHPGCVDGLE
jgi:uncharacterized membrane protein